jgi:GDP-4-dehydro-6-deoxy-D-mannose reductase
MSKTKSLLITGCNGFIGKAAIKHFLGTGEFEKLHGISRSNYSFENNRFSHHKVDLLSPELVALVKKINPSVVIHLASQRYGSLDQLFQNNVLATENLLNAIIANQIQSKCKIIVIGSSAEIGIPPDNQPIHEQADCTPIDDYGLTKLMQSKLALKKSMFDNLDIIRLRLFNVIGVGLPETLLAGRAIKAFSAQIKDPSYNITFGDLSSKRDYVDISDVLSAFEKAIQFGKKGQLYHIGSGMAHSGKELIELIRSKAPSTKRSLTFSYDSLARSMVAIQMGDNKKAITELNWEPTTSLAESITNMWTYNQIHS